MAAKKKMPRFYSALIVCWVIALSALVIGLLFLATYLKDYESVQPKYTADEVFREYFEKKNFTYVLDHPSVKLGSYETKDSIGAYLSALVGENELSYHNISSGMDLDTSKYIVKYSEGERDVKIASFELVKSGEKSPKGFDKYALAGFELFYPAEKSVALKVTKGSVPYINGIPLDDGCIKEEGIEHENNAHLPEGVSGIFYTLYYVDELTSTPSVTVKNAEGADIPLFFNNEENCYETELVYDEALAAEMGERAAEAGKILATYMQNDCKIAKVTPYFEKGTPLYKSITSTLQWAVIDHDSYTFEDIETSEFYRYDENTFSCRVKMTHVLKRKRLEDYRDRVDATFFFREINGKYMVYDRTNN